MIIGCVDRFRWSAMVLGAVFVYYPCQRLGAWRARLKISASLFWTGLVSVSMRWALGGRGRART